MKTILKHTIKSVAAVGLLVGAAFLQSTHLLVAVLLVVAASMFILSLGKSLYVGINGLIDASLDLPGNTVQRVFRYAKNKKVIKLERAKREDEEMIKAIKLERIIKELIATQGGKFENDPSIVELRTHQKSIDYKIIEVTEGKKAKKRKAKKVKPSKAVQKLAK